MKKIIVTILAIAYLGTSTGAMVNMHYCMGKLANWGIGNDDSRTCGKCGMEKKNKGGCCQDEHLFIKSSQDQKITESTSNNVELLTTALPVPSVEFASIDLPHITKETTIGHGLPSHHGVYIYILTCDYRI